MAIGYHILKQVDQNSPFKMIFLKPKGASSEFRVVSEGN